jgi:uncharacterized protein YcbK (DUF882 family)
MNLNENIQRIKEMMGLDSNILNEQYPPIARDNTYVRTNYYVPKEFKQVIKNTNPYEANNNSHLSGVDTKLKDIFNKIQNEFGAPLKIESGARDKQQNASKGGAKKSAHLQGKAIDIKLEKPDQKKILKIASLATKHGVLGLGIYRDGQNIHIDIDAEKGRRAWGSDYTSGSIPSWAKTTVTNHLNNRYS